MGARGLRSMEEVESTRSVSHGRVRSTGNRRSAAWRAQARPWGLPPWLARWLSLPPSATAESWFISELQAGRAGAWDRKGARELGCW